MGRWFIPGSAACCAERLCLSVAFLSETFSCAQAGRLSLPACAQEEKVGWARPESLRLSAQQAAEPHR